MSHKASLAAWLTVVASLCATEVHAEYHTVTNIQVGGEGGWDYLEPDPISRRLFVACHSKTLLVLDADAGTILASFPIGAGNDAVKFDPASKLAFASNADGTLAVVQENGANAFSLVQTVRTQTGARTMAVDPKTHRLFLPSADFMPATPATAANPQPRRSIVPGSFRVLVLEP